MPWKLGADSFSKMVVYFTDGNCRTFYSLDWAHRLSRKRDRGLGLQRLRKLLRKWGQDARVAILYDNTSGSELERYAEGNLQATPNPRNDD